MNLVAPKMHSLDSLAKGVDGEVVAIDWDVLDAEESCRLRHFGLDIGVRVAPMHLGPFGADPIAVRVGRMTVAMRRKHARAIMVRCD